VVWDLNWLACSLHRVSHNHGKICAALIRTFDIFADFLYIRWDGLLFGELEKIDENEIPPIEEKDDSEKADSKSGSNLDHEEREEDDGSKGSDEGSVWFR
jgi:hypothetical protein